MTPDLSIDRAACEALDAADPLAALRSEFTVPDGVIYLDGNSLGALPRATADRVAQTITQEWGTDLIRSWNKADWMHLPHRVGDKIARLIGVGPGEVVVADSTSINLYKTLWAATALQRHDPARRVLLVDESAFPTDLYVAQSVAQAHGLVVKSVAPQHMPQELGPDAAAVLINHVDYRTGRLHDMTALTTAAHAHGVLVVWDLAHSAGALPVDLHAADADFAVGCGYKYLNGGPGAPAFVWAHPRHVNASEQPLTGWHGHAAPFQFTPDYVAAQGITRFLVGTPPVLSMVALECGIDSLLAAQPLGGMNALRTKSLALTGVFRQLVAVQCPELTCITPVDGDDRGSQLAFTHPDGAYAIVQALIERGVIGDFRMPDVLRFAVTPAYTRFVDVWDAVEHLAQVLATNEWREPRFAVRAAVT